MSRTDEGQATSAGQTIRDTANQVQQTLRDAGSQVRDAATDKVNELRDQANQLRDHAGEYYEQGKQRAQEWEQGLEDYIREKPLQSLLIAAGVGVLLGVLWKRS